MNKKEIGNRLKTLRGDRTQEEVANAVNVSPSSYSSYENGTRTPRDDVKERLAKYFKRSIAFIFYK